MCLYIKQSTKPTPKVATKPITVYKRLCLENYSPYRYFDYECNDIITSEIDEPTKYGSRYEINRGLHAYTTIKAAVSDMDRVYEKIVEMTIPEGAIYYKGEHKEIVTNILITGELEALEI